MVRENYQRVAHARPCFAGRGSWVRVPSSPPQKGSSEGIQRTVRTSLSPVVIASRITLYLAWGSKRALLRAYMEAALAGDDETSYSQALTDIIADVLDGVFYDPQAIVRQISVLYRQIAERAALGWQLYRGAAATDPEIASDWQALRALRHQTFTTLIERLPAGSLRPGLTRAAATDTAWAIASPDTYDMLVRTRGYTLDRYQKWVTTSLTTLLLRPTSEAPAGVREDKPKR
jgi:AcrR family transcriptional regulator